MVGVSGGAGYYESRVITFVKAVKASVIATESSPCKDSTLISEIKQLDQTLMTVIDTGSLSISLLFIGTQVLRSSGWFVTLGITAP